MTALRKLSILFYLFFGLLAFALLWRIFFYERIAVPVTAPVPVIQEPLTPQQVGDADLILDLFNPTDDAVNAQVSESTLKRQLEEAITVTFLLRRCERLSSDDYYNTFRALRLYSQRMQPGKEIEPGFQEVIASGSASYSLMYARADCSMPQLATSQAQLAQWREAILNPPKQ